MNGPFFSPEDRARVERCVLEWAQADLRVKAGAVVGSRALGAGDRWSDIDLSFAVDPGLPLPTLLDEWGARLAADFAATALFDVSAGPFLYRVFLLPGCLQCDLSVAPAGEWGPRGPSWRLLFGSAAPAVSPPPPEAALLFGEAVHHALRARFAIERGQFWQAEFWLGELRDQRLALACRRLGLPTRYARGVDALPPSLLTGTEGALPRSLDAQELRRALGVAIGGLILEAEKSGALEERTAAALRTLAQPGPEDEPTPLPSR